MKRQKIKSLIIGMGFALMGINTVHAGPGHCTQGTGSLYCWQCDTKACNKWTSCKFTNGERDCKRCTYNGCTDIP